MLFIARLRLLKSQENFQLKLIEATLNLMNWSITYLPIRPS
jgi:hypothetical protein